MLSNRTATESILLSIFVLTSPLGVVPYQLERVYPANSYDIPVTGIWSHEEKMRVLDILNTVLSHYKSKKIICHVTGPYIEICKELKGHELVFTAEQDGDNPSSGIIIVEWFSEGNCDCT